MTNIVIALSLYFASSLAWASGSETEVPVVYSKQFNQDHPEFAEFLKKTSMNSPRSLESMRKNKKVLETYLNSILGLTRSEFQDMGEAYQKSFLLNVFNAHAVQFLVHQKIQPNDDGILKNSQDHKFELFPRQPLN